MNSICIYYLICIYFRTHIPHVYFIYIYTYFNIQYKTCFSGSNPLEIYDFFKAHVFFFKHYVGQTPNMGPALRPEFTHQPTFTTSRLPRSAYSDGTIFWSRPGIVDSMCKLLGGDSEVGCWREFGSKARKLLWDPETPNRSSLSHLKMMDHPGPESWNPTWSRFSGDIYVSFREGIYPSQSLTWRNLKIAPLNRKLMLLETIIF